MSPTHPEAAGLLAQLAKYVPAEGVVAVEGGTEGESLRPLDFAPYPDTPARSLLAPDAIANDLVRLAGAPGAGWRLACRLGPHLSCGSPRLAQET